MLEVTANSQVTIPGIYRQRFLESIQNSFRCFLPKCINYKIQSHDMLTSHLLRDKPEDNTYSGHAHKWKILATRENRNMTNHAKNYMNIFSRTLFISYRIIFLLWIPNTSNTKTASSSSATVRKLFYWQWNQWSRRLSQRSELIFFSIMKYWLRANKAKFNTVSKKYDPSGNPHLSKS